MLPWRSAPVQIQNAPPFCEADAPLMTLYQTLADDIASRIQQGLMRPGERLPSVRQWCVQRGLSQATVLKALAQLVDEGWVESRPRSGHFVRAASARLPLSPPPPPQRAGRAVAVSDLVFDILAATRDRSLLPLGSAFPSPTLFPLPALATSLARAARRLDPWMTVADLPPGSWALRREIAKRYLANGVRLDPDEIIITAGAMEALNLSLQAVAPPGSLVAVESPCFYGALQAIERLGLRAVEVPTHPVEGIDLEALATILARHPVRACWFMPSFQNPLGSLMPPARRAALMALLAEHDLPLIEDDVYAELYFDRHAPAACKRLDDGGRVLHCGSFSKALAPGYRVGWVAAGRHADALLRLKASTSLATSIPVQEGIADYLARGVWDLHLRRLRRTLETQRDQLLDAIRCHFPADTAVTVPSGGYFLWARLPPSVDSLRLQRAAAEHGIGLSPGPMFSAHRGFRHCLRLNYGHPWSPSLAAGLATLGRLIADT